MEQESGRAIGKSGKKAKTVNNRKEIDKKPDIVDGISRRLSELKPIELGAVLKFANLTPCQVRVKSLDTETVTSYADRLARTEPPPITVISPTAGIYIIADGHHRAAAAAKANRATIVANVFEGTEPDAHIVGIELNRGGLPFTPADRRKAVDAMLSDNPELSFTYIADMVGVERHTVANRRAALRHGRLLSQVADLKPGRTSEEKEAAAARLIARQINKFGVDILAAALEHLPPHIRNEAVESVAKTEK